MNPPEHEHLLTAEEDGSEVQMTKERAEELIEIFTDADRRAGLSEAEINACPAIDEVLEAVHGA
jgi:hypothetical protein